MRPWHHGHRTENSSGRLQASRRRNHHGPGPGWIDLFGQAKYEPQADNPWNGEVTGSVSEDEVDLTVTAEKDNALVSSKLSGTFDQSNGTINGKVSHR